MTITDSRPAIGISVTLDETPDGADGQQSMPRSTPMSVTTAGANSPPTKLLPTPNDNASGGDQLTGGRRTSEPHGLPAAGDQQADRHWADDVHGELAVGFTPGQDQTAGALGVPQSARLSDPALVLAADILDDIERVRTANENRLRQLTRSVEDSDGEIRGFGLNESHPDVARLAAMVETLTKVEADAIRNLERKMRQHPLGPWAKSRRGIGDKQIARLLAAIGDPYIRPELCREDGTVLPEGPRTVSALWAYCGLHVLPADQMRNDAHMRTVGGSGDNPGHVGLNTRSFTVGVAPKRRRGQKSNWSTSAKTKAYLIAKSCIKQLVKPCATGNHVDDCMCSEYRLVYDKRRAHTAITHPEWTDMHALNDALRVMSKSILRDLWREAKRLHELPTPTGGAAVRSPVGGAGPVKPPTGSR